MASKQQLQQAPLYWSNIQFTFPEYETLMTTLINGNSETVGLITRHEHTKECRLYKVVGTKVTRTARTDMNPLNLEKYCVKGDSSPDERKRKIKKEEVEEEE